MQHAYGRVKRILFDGQRTTLAPFLRPYFAVNYFAPGDISDCSVYGRGKYKFVVLLASTRKDLGLAIYSFHI